MKKHYKALLSDDGESWIGIAGGSLVVSPIPFLLPYSVDRTTIENAIASTKIDTETASGEKLRYKIVEISLEIVQNKEN